MKKSQWKMDSPVGCLYLVATDKGLESIFFDKLAVTMAKNLNDEPILAQAVRELEEYFAGDRKTFSVPLDLTVGTPFQRQVWSQLSRIPYGKTCSYRDVAKNLKNEKAVRAVGSANGKNPVCIIVPCHRVIAADGTLGGYSGGLDKKVKLLALEGVTDCRPGRPDRKSFRSKSNRTTTDHGPRRLR